MSSENTYMNKELSEEKFKNIENKVDRIINNHLPHIYKEIQIVNSDLKTYIKEDGAWKSKLNAKAWAFLVAIFLTLLGVTCKVVGIL
jgi:hypothetical protein